MQRAVISLRTEGTKPVFQTRTQAVATAEQSKMDIGKNTIYSLNASFGVIYNLEACRQDGPEDAVHHPGRVHRKV